MKNQWVLFISIILLLVACTPNILGESQHVIPTNLGIPEMETEKTPYSDSTGVEIGEKAIIDDIELIYTSGWPDEIGLEIMGNLPDGCTEISEITQTRNTNIFNIKVNTTRPFETECTMALVPFTENIFLDLSGLADGVYQVIVYDKVVSFEIDIYEEPEYQGG